MSMDSEERTDSRFHSTPDPVGEGDSTPVSEGPLTLYFCRRSGQLAEDCGLTACEYAHDEYEVAFVPESRATDAEAERDRLREALEYMADPENWMGNPESQESTLHGHDTPYELARSALTTGTDDG